MPADSHDAFRDVFQPADQTPPTSEEIDALRAMRRARTLGPSIQPGGKALTKAAVLQSMAQSGNPELARISEELAQDVRDAVADRSLAAHALAQMEALGAQLAEARAHAAELEAALARAGQHAPGRASLLKAFAAAACPGGDPSSLHKRGLPTELARRAERLGIGIHDDSVRKIIREASEMIREANG